MRKCGETGVVSKTGYMMAGQVVFCERIELQMSDVAEGAAIADQNV